MEYLSDYESESQVAGENPGKKIPPTRKRIGGIKKRIGSDLLSHTVAHAVPSALKSLTSVFGMGTGVTSSLLPPKNRELNISLTK